MIYTFQISDESTQSQSIINMLLSLSKDYDFIKVIEEEGELTNEMEEELDHHHETFLEKSHIEKPGMK